MDGLVIPGGCDTCDATQEISQVDCNVHKMTVRHDDECPTLARHQGR